METDQKYDARLSPKAAALSRGSLAQQLNQQPSYDMTAEQQIRAKALECAAIYATSGELIMTGVRALLDVAEDLETYIRDGK